MALDPFQGLSAEARRRGYDPLAIMAGLGVGQQRAAELATERQRRQAEAEQQASQLQMQARQMTMQEEQAKRQLEESQAQRAIEMERLGMTRLQQEQEAALQGRRLDQELTVLQRQEAQSALDREARRQEQDAIRAAAQREADISRAFEAAKMWSEYNQRFGKGGELDRARQNAIDIARATAEAGREDKDKLPSAVLTELLGMRVPTGAVDETGQLLVDADMKPLTRPATPQEIFAKAQLARQLLGLAPLPTVSNPTVSGSGETPLDRLLKLLEKGRNSGNASRRFRNYEPTNEPPVTSPERRDMTKEVKGRW